MMNPRRRPTVSKLGGNARQHLHQDMDRMFTWFKVLVVGAFAVAAWSARLELLSSQHETPIRNHDNEIRQLQIHEAASTEILTNIKSTVDKIDKKLNP